jgi:hypothetical protein
VNFIQPSSLYIAISGSIAIVMIRLRIHSNDWKAPAAASTGVSHAARAGSGIGRDGGWAGGRITRK